MFVLEQEEYKREGIDWVFIDFGLDLAKTIELIEKPLGIMSILEEECMFPKASDKTFKDKLFTQHMGKTSSFGKSSSKSKGQKDVDFELYHYAGCVGYNISGWLDKNKDPMNNTVCELLRSSENPLMAGIWAEYKTPEELIEEEKKAQAAGGKKKKKGKGASFITVSAVHRESLARLMTNLKATDPHFVRCIVPNEHKKPGYMEASLVLHQLRCNGVLEGIRICRKGFPNRMMYPEFIDRYEILNPNYVKEGEEKADIEKKTICERILTTIPVDQDKFRFGHTKAFFRAGFLAVLEEMREERLSAIFLGVQARYRFNAAREDFKVKKANRAAARVIQGNLRSFFFVRNWEWMKLIYKIKPLLEGQAAAKEMDELLEDVEKLQSSYKEEKKKREELELLNMQLLEEKTNLMAELEEQGEALADAEDKIERLQESEKALKAKVAELEAKMNADGEALGNLTARNKELEAELESTLATLAETEAERNQLRKDKENLETQVSQLTEDINTMTEQMEKLAKEKKNLQEAQAQLMEDLMKEEDKVNNLTKIRAKLESDNKKLETDLATERKEKVDLERNMRKLEGDLRVSQETIFDLDSQRMLLEEKLKKNNFHSVQLGTKLEDEQALVAQLQKKIKELQNRIEELEEDLETERQNKAKTDKQRDDLVREMEEMKEKLGDSLKLNSELNDAVVWGCEVLRRTKFHFFVHNLGFLTTSFLHPNEKTPTITNSDETAMTWKCPTKTPSTTAERSSKTNLMTSTNSSTP